MLTDKQIAPLVYWSPSSEPEHEEAYRQVLREWYPQYETVPGQIALERRIVQEKAEADAERDGREFILIRATPRYVRQLVAAYSMQFTQENAQTVLYMQATLPGFDRDRVYDIDEMT